MNQTLTHKKILNKAIQVWLTKEEIEALLFFTEDFNEGISYELSNNTLNANDILKKALNKSKQS